MFLEISQIFSSEFCKISKNIILQSTSGRLFLSQVLQLEPVALHSLFILVLLFLRNLWKLCIKLITYWDNGQPLRYPTSVWPHCAYNDFAKVMCGFNTGPSISDLQQQTLVGWNPDPHRWSWTPCSNHNPIKFLSEILRCKIKTFI